jgi:CDP-glucose 4,6-dehydratase
MTRPGTLSGFDGAYHGRRVLVTGDSGFKGGWLASWLHALGAEVTGLSLPPPTEPSLFEQADLSGLIPHWEGDIRDPDVLRSALAELRPQVVFHLAAQAIVRRSYQDPLETFGTNVMGTAHLLEAVRAVGAPCSVVVVTSDKAYANQEWEHGYRESDALGGRDPYSGSKGAAEIVTASYRESFFPVSRLHEHGTAVASARAGNVVGMGDWARDRLVPDAISALGRGEPVPVRNPDAVRPWQHVLEPLAGYLLLGSRLSGESAGEACQAWNFGPRPEACRAVREVVEALLQGWGDGRWVDASESGAPHEAKILRLSIEKAVGCLGWRPVWGFDETMRRTAEGYRRLGDAADAPDSVRRLMQAELEAYTSDAARAGVTWARS